MLAVNLKTGNKIDLSQEVFDNLKAKGLVVEATSPKIPDVLKPDNTQDNTGKNKNANENAGK